MKKSELVRRVVSVLKQSGIRKKVIMPKHKFHISDDDGNIKSITVRESSKESPFNIEEVGAIIDATLAVIKDSLKHNESVAIRGFGTFCLRYIRASRSRHPTTGELVDNPAHYSPKFSPSADLRRCAKAFELGEADKDALYIEPIYEEDIIAEEMEDDECTKDLYDDELDMGDGGDE